MKRLIGLVLLGLAGCEEHQEEWRNTDPGRISQQQWDKDGYECAHENTRSEISTVMGRVYSQPETDERMVRLCMKARGWYQVR